VTFPCLVKNPALRRSAISERDYRKSKRVTSDLLGENCRSRMNKVPRKLAHRRDAASEGAKCYVNRGTGRASEEPFDLCNRIPRRWRSGHLTLVLCTCSYSRISTRNPSAISPFSRNSVTRETALSRRVPSDRKCDETLVTDCSNHLRSQETL